MVTVSVAGGVAVTVAVIVAGVVTVAVAVAVIASGPNWLLLIS